MELTVSGIVLINVLETFGVRQGFGISEVSLLGATILLLSSSRRRGLLKKMDWGILLMFASLFVLMQAVWNAGIVTELSRYLPSLDKSNPMASLMSIFASSVLLSQVLSNVPMVALFLPVMKSVGYDSNNIASWVALAGGSTLAGNLTLLGAASNLIIVEEAEAKGHSISFFEFFKVRVLVTAVNVAVLYLFLVFMP
ncbi:MAG: SLC13 family permease [Nitrososphaeria archaeon]